MLPLKFSSSDFSSALRKLSLLMNLGARYAIFESPV
ncbi:hypothetical protein Phi87_48 [Enterobacteria phage UAB_Phi87]|uniref:Uncharacterized protein n=1 Tax=Enterobacteria phage UAB_Phi87 TaxID=1197935 RepID=M1FN57_9CAUD|nr:hypothetical protein Phi87_48 [Enterobacteria phage UAB_Phi87]AFQ96089.1 hypothetical protein Phi87_48 [Enterobacteria phage UAB_Phi87]